MLVKIALYDDQRDHPDEGGLVRQIVRWIEETHQDKCVVRTFVSAAQLLADVIGGYRPDVAIIDIKGTHDPSGDAPNNLLDAFDEAARQGLDIMEHLDEEILTDNNTQFWFNDKAYGIGLLALLKAAGCHDRMAFTNEYTQGELVKALHESHLANLGVCAKETNKAKRRLTHVIEEAYARVSSHREVPDPYEIVILEEADEEGNDGLVKRMRVRLTEKKTELAVK